MIKIMLLLLLLSLVAAVRLPISEQYTVSLLVGNPGVHLSFHLNLTSNYVELHTPLQRLSNTFDSDDISGTEIFYVGDKLLWLPFVYNLLPEQELYQFYEPVHGTIGLGKHSPLWRYYDNYTICSKYIVLGEYDEFAQLDHTARPPPLHDSEVTCVLDGDVEQEVRIDPSHVDTYLPVEYYEKPPVKFRFSDPNCAVEYAQLGLDVEECNDVEFEMSHTLEETVSGVLYLAAKPTDDPYISLGLHWLKEQSYFVDVVKDFSIFSPSVFSKKEMLSNAVCVLFLMLTLIAWLMLVIVNKYETRWTYNLSLQFEGFGYLTAVLAYITNSFGLWQSAYLANFAKTSPIPYLIYIGGVLLLSLGVFLYIFAPLLSNHFHGDSDAQFEVSKKRSSRFKDLRLLFFVTSVLAVFFLCIVHRHDEFVDLIYLLGSAAGIAFVCTVSTANAFVRSENWAFPLLFYTLAAYVFFGATVGPAMNVVSIDNKAAGIIWMCGIVLAVSFILYTKYAILKLEISDKKKT